MRKRIGKGFKVIGAILGLVLAVFYCSRLAISMDAYQKQTGIDAGNAGVLGCFAIFLFPSFGWAIGSVITRYANRGH